jgi:L-aspartate oxidase
MGGITATPEGRTNVRGLYAVGECAYTGVHGNNRLASNSLLEALVFARMTAAAIIADLPCKTAPPQYEFPPTGTKPLPCGIVDRIREIMQSAYFVTPAEIGDSRHSDFAQICEYKELLESGEFALTADFVQAKSLVAVAYLILKEVLENARKHEQ